MRSLTLAQKRELSRLLTTHRPAPTDTMHAAGMEPDDWQRRVLLSRAPRLLLLCSRQSGKSTTTAALAAHEAIHHPGALVLLLAPGLRQSGELARKVMSFYRALPAAPRPVGDSALRLELENGSRIVALPGEEGTVRGYSGVRLLVVDEASRVPDELYFAVRPMLAVSGGRLLALTTPYGKRGWFYESWSGPEPWERVRVTAEQCPRIEPAFLAEERRVLGSRWYRQEYECSFEETEDSLFREADIQRALSHDDVAPLFPQETTP